MGEVLTNEVVEQESIKVAEEVLAERVVAMELATEVVTEEIADETLQEESTAVAAELMEERRPETPEQVVEPEPKIDAEALTAMEQIYEELAEEVCAEECRQIAEQALADAFASAAAEDAAIIAIFEDLVGDECAAVAGEMMTEEAARRAEVETAATAALAETLMNEVADEMSAEIAATALRAPDEAIANGILEEFVREECAAVAREVIDELAAKEAATAAAAEIVAGSVLDETVREECLAVAQDVLDEARGEAATHDAATAAIRDEILEELIGEMIKQEAKEALEQETSEVFVAELEAELTAEESAAVAQEVMQEAFVPPDDWEVEFAALVDVSEETGDVSKVNESGGDDLMIVLSNNAEAELDTMEATKPLEEDLEPDPAVPETSEELLPTEESSRFRKTATRMKNAAKVIKLLSTESIMRGGAWKGNGLQPPLPPKLRVAAMVAVAASWGAADRHKTVQQIFSELPGWCDEQREAKKDGNLAVEKERRLDELGFDWGDKDKETSPEPKPVAPPPPPPPRVPTPELELEVQHTPPSPPRSPPPPPEPTVFRVASPAPLLPPRPTRRLNGEGGGGGAHGAIHPQSVREQNVVAHRRHVREVAQAEAVRVAAEYSGGSTALPDVVCEIATELNEAGIRAPKSWELEAEHQRREKLSTEYSGVSVPHRMASPSRNPSPGWDGGRTSSPLRPTSRSLVQWAPGMKDRGEGRYNINPPPSADDSFFFYSVGDDDDAVLSKHSGRPGTAPVLATSMQVDQVKMSAGLRGPRLLSAAAPMSQTANQWWLRPTTASPKKGAAAVEEAAQRRYSALAREIGASMPLLSAMATTESSSVDVSTIYRPGSSRLSSSSTVGLNSPGNRRGSGGGSAHTTPGRFSSSRRGIPVSVSHNTSASSSSRRIFSAGGSSSASRQGSGSSMTGDSSAQTRITRRRSTLGDNMRASRSLSELSSLDDKDSAVTGCTAPPPVTAIAGDQIVSSIAAPTTPMMPGMAVGVVITGGKRTGQSRHGSARAVSSGGLGGDGQQRGGTSSSTHQKSTRAQSPYESAPSRPVLYSGGSPRVSMSKTRNTRQPRLSQPRSSSGSAASKMAKRVAAADADGIIMGPLGAGAGAGAGAYVSENTTWSWAPQAPPAPPATAAEAAAAGAAFHPAHVHRLSVTSGTVVQQQTSFGSNPTLPPRPGTAVTSSSVRNHRGGDGVSNGLSSRRFSMYATSRRPGTATGYGGTRRFSVGAGGGASTPSSASRVRSSSSGYNPLQLKAEGGIVSGQEAPASSWAVTYIAS